MKKELKIGDSVRLEANFGGFVCGQIGELTELVGTFARVLFEDGEVELPCYLIVHDGLIAEGDYIVGAKVLLTEVFTQGSLEIAFGAEGVVTDQLAVGEAASREVVVDFDEGSVVIDISFLELIEE